MKLKKNLINWEQLTQIHYFGFTIPTERNQKVFLRTFSKRRLFSFHMCSEPFRTYRVWRSFHSFASVVQYIYKSRTILSRMVAFGENSVTIIYFTSKHERNGTHYANYTTVSGFFFLANDSRRQPPRPSLVLQSLLHYLRLSMCPSTNVPRRLLKRIYTARRGKKKNTFRWHF